MKAIIDGKRYDTERAPKMAEYGNGLGRSDFRNLDEELYRTDVRARGFPKTGEGGDTSAAKRSVTLRRYVLRMVARSYR